jgi:hypothetical protein
MLSFRRRCRACGQPASLTVAEHLDGRAGDVEVEFTDFPYRSCSCGKLTRWAFDPGTDLSTQLFWESDRVATAKGSLRHPRCARCGSELRTLQPVDLVAEAHLEGFAPIGFHARLSGYVCSSCGLAQAPPDTWADDGAAALMDAARAVGLR